MVNSLSENVAIVEFVDGFYNLGRPYDVEVLTLWDKHEVAIISYGYPKSSLVIPPEMTKVVVTHGTVPTGIKQFYGYVNHHEEGTTQGSATLRLILIGTSQPFNSTNPTSWTSVTASYIARQVADRYGLRPVLTRTGEIIGHWAQGPESDFKMLERLGERAGCKFWVSNGSLYFVDPTTYMAAAGRAAEVLVMNGDIGDTLLKIESVAGSMAPENGRRVNVAHGLQKSTLASGSVVGTVLKASSGIKQNALDLDLGQYRNVIHYQSKTMGEAQHIADSATNVGNWSTAIAYVSSKTPLRTGDIVETAGSKCPISHVGTWLVAGVNDKYALLPDGATRTSILTLVRNQRDGHVFKTGAAAFTGRTPITDCVSRPGTVLWSADETGAIYV